MGKTFLDISRFTRKGNLIGQYSPSHEFVCEKSYVYEVLPDTPARMRIGTGEKIESVNCGVDFTVQPSHNVALLERDGQKLWNKIAVAFDPVTGKKSYANAYNSGDLTFTAISGGGINDIYIFYLLGEGNIRLELANPGRNIIASTALFEGSIHEINTKDQQSYKSYMMMYRAMKITDAMKLQLNVLSNAPIIMDSRELVDTGTNISPALLYLPVIATRSDLVQGKEVAQKEVKA